MFSRVCQSVFLLYVRGFPCSLPRSLFLLQEGRLTRITSNDDHLASASNSLVCSFFLRGEVQLFYSQCFLRPNPSLFRVVYGEDRRGLFLVEGIRYLAGGGRCCQRYHPCVGVGRERSFPMSRSTIRGGERSGGGYAGR